MRISSSTLCSSITASFYFIPCCYSIILVQLLWNTYIKCTKSSRMCDVFPCGMIWTMSRPVVRSTGPEVTGGQSCLAVISSPQ